MADYFKDLDRVRDWRAVVENLALAGLSAASLDLANAYRSIRDAATGSRSDPSTDERAGVWLRTTAATALLTLLNDPRFGGPLDRNDARKAAARAFVAEALSLKGLDRFDRDGLANPADLPPLRMMRDALPGFLRATTDDLAPNDAEIHRRFDELLRSVSARAHALDPDFYAPLVAVLSGPFRIGYDRDLAWAAHANWIAGRMDEPIFAPDAPQAIPLRAVYHRLRCWWEADRPADPDAPPGPRVILVADLHRTLRAWLDAPDRRAPIRVVAGGPGSGKSSFARAFAGGDALDAGWRVVFVELQHMALRGGLDTAFGAYLIARNKRNVRGEGFDENPLDWRASDPDVPVLLVFDGLDELSRAEDEARDLSRRFIAEIARLLASMNGPGAPVRALFLGRSAACAAALKEANLPTSTLLHVAPLTPLEASSFGSGNALRDLELQICDPLGLCERDEREDFWRRYARVQGEKEEPAPEAITADQLGDLAAEVLLLHLLIVSGYTGPNWAEAAENRNRVY